MRTKSDQKNKLQGHTGKSEASLKKNIQAEGPLQNERALFQAIINGAKNLHLVYLDRDFNFVLVNETYAATCGYRPEEMIGKNHFALYPHAENEAIFSRVRDTGEPFEVYDKPFEFPDQPQRGVTYWDWTLTPVKDQSGSVEGLVFSLHETTARKQAEEALSQSEQRVRQKLESILSPGDDIGDLELSDIIDAGEMQSLLDDFYKLVRIPMAIIDTRGKVLVGVGWQKICTEFHRAHPETCKYCIESDTQLSANVLPGEFRLYKCKNSMWDVATPIIVGGKHMGNLFTGQFFFEGEPIDYKLFRSQAKTYGFNEQEYIAALDAVPRLSRETLDSGMSFFLKLADILSKLSYSNIKLSRSLTERDNLLKSLRESEDQFRILTENSPDCIALHDTELRHIYVNPEVSKLIRLPMEAFVGKTVWEMGMPPEAASQLDSLLRKTLETGQMLSGELIFPAGNETRFLLWRSVPIFRNDGTTKAVLAIATDITERKKTERALLESEQSLLRLSEELGDLVLDRTRFYSILAHINEAIVRIRDRQSLFEEVCRVIVEKGLLRLAWIGIIDPESRVVRPAASFGESGYLDGLKIIADDVPEGKGPTGRAIYEDHYVINSDFEKNPLLLPWRDRARAHGLRSSSAFPLHTGGRVIGALTIYSGKQDFFNNDEEISLMSSLAENLSFALDSIETEEKRAEAEGNLRLLNEELEVRVKMRTSELEDANREMESFIYTVSHDLRAPLRHISGFAKILTEDYPDSLDTTARDYLARIGRSVARMDRLVDDLLRLSMISKQELSKTKVDLSVLAMSVVSGLREADAGRKVETVIQKELKADADRWLIETVLTNLLSNSWKFTSKTENARIEFGAINEETGQMGLMRPVYFVRDNGAGFNNKYADKLFRPFHRLHNMDEFEGTGIGLAIVELVIRRHGGKVWAEGETGKGATIYFTLEENKKV